MSKRPTSKKPAAKRGKAKNTRAVSAKRKPRAAPSPVIEAQPVAGSRGESRPISDEPKKRGRGQPTVCTPEALEEILDRIALGEYLEDICKDEHLPCAMTVRRHKRRDDKFCSAYARAREDQMESFEYKAHCVATDGSQDFKEIVDQKGNKRVVVDHEAIERSKLIVSQYRWTMAKIAPYIYGERVAVDVTDANPLATALDRAKRRAYAAGVMTEDAADGRQETAH